uniref:hypothetical protein n=1 Tax=Ndongobacter massiliensis TaxID=1871025 RepID=UPI000A6B4425|nr:hypothetical protein [Ndongobacter massiliensis]
MEIARGKRKKRTTWRFYRMHPVLRWGAIFIGMLGAIGWCLFGTWMLYALMVR